MKTLDIVGLPDFDKMNQQDLHNFLIQIGMYGLGTMCTRMFQVKDATTEHATSRLSDFVHASIMAKEHFDNGDTVKAIIHKERMDNIYNSLPSFAQWRN